MRRSITAHRVVFTLAPYRSLTARESDALQRAASRYGEYLDLDAQLDVR
jgi:hypothetical protein